MSTRTSKPQTRTSRAARALMKQDPTLTYAQALQQIRATRPTDPRTQYRLTPDRPVTRMTNGCGENTLMGYGSISPQRMSEQVFTSLGFDVSYWNTRVGWVADSTEPGTDWHPLTATESDYAPDDMAGDFLLPYTGFTMTTDGKPVKVLLPTAELEFADDDDHPDGASARGTRAQVLALASRYRGALTGLIGPLGGYVRIIEDQDAGGYYEFHEVVAVVPLPAVMAAYPTPDTWTAALAHATETV